MKEEQGLVIAVSQGGQRATVRVGKHDECVACGACAGSRQVTVEALNEASARVGERVVFEMREQQVIKGAFIIFIMPLLVAGVFALAGYYLGADAWLGAYNISIIAGAAGFMLGVIFIKWYDKRAMKNLQEVPVITKVIS